MDSEDRLNYEVTVCELLSLLTQSDVMPEGKETFTSSFDVDEIDLHDDDTCCDHLELKAAELEMTVDEMLLMENTHL